MVGGRWWWQVVAGKGRGMGGVGWEEVGRAGKGRVGPKKQKAVLMPGEETFKRRPCLSASQPEVQSVTACTAMPSPPAHSRAQTKSPLKSAVKMSKTGGVEHACVRTNRLNRAGAT